MHSRNYQTLLKVTVFNVILIIFCNQNLFAQSAWPWKITEETEGTVSLLIMGDTNIQGRVNPESAYKNVAVTLNAADVLFANLEGPFAGTSKDPLYPDIAHKQGWTHSEPDMVDGLLSIDIDGVGVANNVTYPWQALMRSLKVLDKAGIGYTGGGKNLAAAHKPLIINRKDVDFGFLQYTATFWPFDHAARENTPGAATVKVNTYYKPPAQVLDKPGQPPVIITIPEQEELQMMIDDIQNLSKKVDIIVASYHWGVSGDTKVVDYQRIIARAAIDAGADVVVGHGPHVLQAIELWKGKPIFFSLANFVFDWLHMRDELDGLLVRVLVKNKNLFNVSCVPLQRDNKNNPILLDPNVGTGKKMLQNLLAIGGEKGAELFIEGQEIKVFGKH